MGEAADVVRAAFERANANDPDGLVELCDQTIEFHDVPEIPGSTTYRGPEGVRDWLRTVHEISDDLRLDPREVEENGDAVMVETSAEMHGKRPPGRSISERRRSRRDSCGAAACGRDLMAKP